MWVTSEQVENQEKGGKYVDHFQSSEHERNQSNGWEETRKVGRDENTYMVAFKSVTRTNKNEWTKTA